MDRPRGPLRCLKRTRLCSFTQAQECEKEAAAGRSAGDLGPRQWQLRGFRSSEKKGPRRRSHSSRECGRQRAKGSPRLSFQNVYAGSPRCAASRGKMEASEERSPELGRTPCSTRSLQPHPLRELSKLASAEEFLRKKKKDRAAVLCGLCDFCNGSNQRFIRALLKSQKYFPSPFSAVVLLGLGDFM